MIDQIFPKDFMAVEEKSPGQKILDVRTEAEFAVVHAKGAVNIPLDELSRETLESKISLGSDESLYIICRSGRRSLYACEMLESQGIQGPLVNIEGGTMLWVEDGLPFVKPS